MNGENSPEQPGAEIKPTENLHKQERMWNMLCHITALCGLIGIPFGNILGPLVIWLLKKNEFSSVDVHGKKALNFQITMAICGMVAGVLCLIFIGFLLLIPIVIADIVLTVMAAVKANNGEEYDYPFSLNLIK
ncbi:MAG: DUF4870 domain-containing protein [Candidatus Omnitrophica bacterium]|nr:DUF4870 domain-containing protein [Candidatus Omnitrophota bacterium]